MFGCLDFGIIRPMKKCCMFAGQGAQVPGMGKDFAEADAEVMALFDKADAVWGFDLKKTKRAITSASASAKSLPIPGI